MKTKNRILSLALVLLCLPVLGIRAAELPVDSKVTAVTVYRTLARETRSAIANLPAGRSEVVLSGVTLDMLDPSIQVRVKGIGTLVSATVRTNHLPTIPLTQAEDKRGGILRDSIWRLGVDLRWVREEQTVRVGELNLIEKLLGECAAQKESKPADFSACADIYRERVMALKRMLFELKLKEEGLGGRLERHQAQLNELAPRKGHPIKEIVLAFQSDAAATIQLHCSYLVQNAGWVPLYDLNVANTSSPVAVTYKAGIFQRTGFGWDDVKVTVSTSTPGLNNDRPILNPHHLEYVAYQLTPSSESNSMYVAKPQERETEPQAIQEAMVLQPTSIHQDYEIELPQRISPDGKQNICKLKEYSMPATYRYHAVPKMESAAFLLARITDYGKYNLLAGQANVFMGETYVGQVDLNPEVTGDTLLVSLGRDENIVVKRERVAEKSWTKGIDGKTKERFAYCITIRNNKTIPIDLEIIDQVPLSRHKELVVQLEEKDGANLEPTIGRLMWLVKLQPSKTKTLELAYTVEYPQGRAVAEQ